MGNLEMLSRWYQVLCNIEVKGASVIPLAVVLQEMQNLLMGNFQTEGQNANEGEQNVN